MSFLGIDPSSSKVGLVLVDGAGYPSFLATWNVRPSKGKWDQAEIPSALADYVGKLEQLLLDFPRRASAAAIELLSVQHNMDTVRKIAYFEAASMIACARVGIPCISVKTTTARKRVLGNGGLSKDAAHPLLEKKASRRLSADEADGYLFAMYAREVYGAASP